MYLRSLPDYALENEIIRSLERRVVASGKQRAYDPHSIRSLLVGYFRSNLRMIGFRARESGIAPSPLFPELDALRDSETQTSALVVGNGPSQAALVPHDVFTFKRNGGHILAVNHYFNSDVLVEVGPTAVVWSDGATIPRILDDPTALRRFRMSVEAANPLFFVPKQIANSVKHSVKQLGIDPKIVTFCDTEVRYRGLRESRSVRPDRPRSYLSMTLLKALAIAQWMGYREILLIGMDNTYPRDLYCSANNQILLRERHAFEADYVNDLTQQFRSVGDFLHEISILMLDLAKFTDERVVNLDPYSLTDTFRKVQSLERAGALLRGEALP